MTEPTRQVPAQVNGVDVITATPAQISDPRPGNEGKMMTMDTMLQVLLADNTETFLCFHRNAPDCGKTSDNPRSILAHQKTHSDRMQAKRLAVELAKTTADKVKAENELAAKKQRRSEQAKKAAATRNANAAAKVVADEPTMPKVVASVAALIREFEVILDEARDNLSDAKILISRAEESLDKIEGKVNSIKELPLADETVVEKARRFDILTTPINQPIK